ncbi:hypothetical protein [Phaeodactylibacter xiamenensis]|uniref:hypothetical protein n=1 Tax=Phaeodactylibacter xiamenensis TaxID=1524460 RepID=UPI003BAB056D
MSVWMDIGAKATSDGEGPACVTQRARSLCDRLLKTNRPALLAPKPTPRQTKPRSHRLAPGIAAFRENRRQTTATQWRGYIV